ncbi:MAG: hypothetical protein RL667_1051 [Pseudomonadota bacterium]
MILNLKLKPRALSLFQAKFQRRRHYSKDLVVLNILIREKNVGVAEIF